MISLISSSTEEGKLVMGQLKKKSVEGGKLLYSGNIHGKNVVYIISGMGKVNAAHAATILFEKFSPRVLILFGVGGAYPSSGLRVGDIAVAEKELYGDEGVITLEGFQGTHYMGIPLAETGRKKYFNEFVLDKELTGKALESLGQPYAGSIAARSGKFITVSTCTGTRRRARELQRRFGGICENMEGAAAAHICALYGVRMGEIRGISNIVEDRDRTKWDIKLAAENCQKVVMNVLRAL